MGSRHGPSMRVAHPGDDTNNYYAAAVDPLEPNTRYQVTALGTDNAGRPLTLEWSFTTGESTTLQTVPNENRRIP